MYFISHKLIEKPIINLLCKYLLLYYLIHFVLFLKCNVQGYNYENNLSLTLYLYVCNKYLPTKILRNWGELFITIFSEIYPIFTESV